LKGFVENSSIGVTLEVEGKKYDVEAFMKSLQSELPPLAHIDTIESTEAPCIGYSDFQILQSKMQTEKGALVSADMAICDNCLQEINDPTNRRYQYPFINCTDCGPRYSIIETVPYDRSNTTMRFFEMCKACHDEYMYPLDRRFHAQPISCPDCGPMLRLLDIDNAIVAGDENAIALTVEAIKKGSIVAVKGLGGFHLICDATNSKAVEELRKRKQRPLKPFAVMFPDMNMIRVSAQVSSDEEVLIRSKEKPIVIVQKSLNTSISESVAPKIDRIGVFLPYTPLHHLLLKELAVPLVATSANRSDEPIIRNSSELIEKLGNVVDLILDHDRDILNANDDSVVQMAGDQKITLRMARGYAPKSIKLPFKSKKKILAVGANQKNSIALIFDDKLIISPHIGDLNSLEAMEYFERTVKTFKRLYDFEADVIVCDMHPEYETVKWTKQLKSDHPSVEIIEVQHHYAHLLAGMAEFQLDSRVLGFAFDGTGYGEDGSIWGGEVMIADNHRYERIATLENFSLLGGERAIREPRRSALALLFKYYSLDEIASLRLPVIKHFSQKEIILLHKAWEQGVNAPMTSSMGRLFDAVASFADIVQVSSFEGEAGLLMEQYADDSITELFPFEIEEGIIGLQPMVRAMIETEDKIKIISMFFNTVIEIIFQTAEKHPELPLLFSGGVFQNRVLVERINRRCREEKRTCYFQNETAINDGGIALGQAWYALHNPRKVF
jgi:hydrogenase maturation protein HypF